MSLRPLPFRGPHENEAVTVLLRDNMMPSPLTPQKEIPSQTPGSKRSVLLFLLRAVSFFSKGHGAATLYPQL